ncbi:MAG: ferredoxin family protein [Candidatus Schekmanbacteria bacterium]|nr:ferredoxin family protein [Candidatus Schekmanbacteria bacterium]
MPAQIDSRRCNRCGRCAQYCPGDIIHPVGGEVVVLYPGECWGCGTCVLECRTGAVTVSLFGAPQAAPAPSRKQATA